MNERDARRRRRKAKATQRIAARDGEVFHLRACCHLEVTVNVGRLRVAHDDDCPAYADPHSDAGYAAKLQATLAVRDRLAGDGMGSTMIIDSAGVMSPALLLW